MATAKYQRFQDFYQFDGFSSKKSKCSFPFLISRMKLNRTLLASLLSVGCIACSNSVAPTSDQADQSKSDKQILSKLDRIERAFDKGDINTACDLQLKLSKDIANYEKISPELLKSLGEFQVKCGSRSFSIDFGTD